MKHLTKEFGSFLQKKCLSLSAYPYEYRDSFKKFGEEKLPDGECFYSPVKDRATGDNGEKLDGHISNEDYLMCTKIWMNLT